MSLGPQIQRRGGDFIHERRGKPKPREIHAFNIVLACFAGFDPYVVVFRRMKVTQLCWSFFAAMSTHDATCLP